MGVMLELVRRRTVNSVICMDGRFESFCSHKNGQVAQLVERWTEDPSVGGSTPSLSTNN